MGDSMVMQNTHGRAAREIGIILTALHEHDEDFTEPVLLAVLGHVQRYMDGRERLTTLIWHLQRFRNEAMIHDAKEAGEVTGG
jgi:hypothetical protein